MVKADIFEGGVYGVIRRAIVIGNGSSGSENQCIGLVQALGLADKHVLYVSSANSSFSRVGSGLVVLVIEVIEVNCLIEALCIACGMRCFFFFFVVVTCTALLCIWDWLLC